VLDQSEQADYSAIAENPEVQGFSYLSHSSNATQDWDFSPDGFDQFFAAIQAAPSPVRLKVWVSISQMISTHRLTILITSRLNQMKLINGVLSRG
jgi:hypothetical protein